MLVSYPDVGFLSGCVVVRGRAGGLAADWWPVVMAAWQRAGGPGVGGPGAAPAQLAALRARDSARRDIGGWGRGRRGGAKAALVMVQLAWPRSLQPLPGIVAGLFDSCRALLPGGWGVLQH